jgi:hypothetical protein
MRVIPVENFVVTVTAEKVERHGRTHWRGHWSIYPGEEYHGRMALAQGETELHASEENAYLFAGTDGVATAKDIAAAAPDG